MSTPTMGSSMELKTTMGSHSAVTSILDLPIELIDRIAIYVQGNDSQGLDSSRPLGKRWSRTIYHITAQDLRHFALTCRKFRNSAQEQLFRRVLLCDLNCRDTDLLFHCLVWSLLARPDLAAKVKEFTIEGTEPGWYLRPNEELALSLIPRIMDLIDHSGLTDRGRKIGWKEDVRQLRPEAFAGVAVLLVPNLEKLFVDTLSFGGSWKFTFLFGDYGRQSLWGRISSQVESLLGLDRIAGFSKLRTLRLKIAGAKQLCGLRHLPLVKCLDLTIHPPRSITLVDQHDLELMEDLQHIEHLRLDCRIREVGYRVDIWFDALRNLLPSFTKIRTLEMYGETESHVWPPGPPYQSDFNASRNRKSYDELLAIIAPFAESLIKLELPAGFWQLITSWGMEPVAGLVQFKDLKELTLPRAALVGTRASWQAVDEAELIMSDSGTLKIVRHSRSSLRSPVAILPGYVEKLRIIDADVITCCWLLQLLSQKISFPNLVTVELIVFTEWADHSDHLQSMVKMAEDKGVKMLIK